MNVKPATAFTWTPIETGITGLLGTIAAGIYDGDTAETALATANVTNEISTSGIYEADFTSPDTEGVYTLIASLDGTLDPDQILTDLLVVTASAPGTAPTGSTYVDNTELARVLKIRTPTAAQLAAMDRVLLAAAGEINAEIDLDDDTTLAGWQIALAAEVNLERAVEHWQQQESPFGIIGLGLEVSTVTSRDSWARHALKLAPLKAQWGFA